VIGADGIQSSLQKHVVEPSTPEYSGSRAPGFDSDGKGSGMAKRGASDLDGRWEALHGLSGAERSTFQRVGAIIFRHLVGKVFMAWQPNGSFRQRGQCLVKVEGQLPVDLNVSCQLSLFFEDSYVSLNFVKGVLERDEFEPEVCFHDEPHGWMLSAVCASHGPIFTTAWTGKGNVRLAARRSVVQAAILLSTSATSADETQELSGVSYANATERGGTRRPQAAAT
jgi:hypothetical protein